MADKKKDVTISAKAEVASGEKAKKQKEEADALKKKQIAENVKAQKAQKAAEEERKAEEKRRLEEYEKAKADQEARREEARKKRAEEEKARKEAEEAAAAAEAEAQAKAEAEKKEKEEKAAALAKAGSIAIAGLAGAAKKSGRLGDFFKGAIAGLLVGVILMLFLWRPWQAVTSTTGGGSGSGLFGGPVLTEHVPDALDEADVVLEQGPAAITFTVADFSDAILGSVSEHQELVVMEQELEIPTTITKAGLGGIAAFSKMKTVTYHGSGVYTIDLSHMDDEHILVDNDAKTVTIRIPHAVLQYIYPDLEATEFEDTEKGILSFGDIKLTMEQQNELAKAVEDAMRERLEKPDLFALADDYGKLKTWEIFQPLVTAVSPEFRVNMEFE